MVVIIKDIKVPIAIILVNLDQEQQLKWDLTQLWAWRLR